MELARFLVGATAGPLGWSYGARELARFVVGATGGPLGCVNTPSYLAT